MAWEKLGTASVGGAGVANTSWKELDRVTLSSAGDSMDTGTFTAKDNIMILEHKIPTGNARSKYRFNADSGNNYAGRRSQSGGSDWTFDEESFLYQYNSGGTAQGFSIAEYSNITAQEKLGIAHVVENNASGAGNVPPRDEYVQKWANTSAQINRVEVFNDGTGDFDTGSEIVILGCDNDEADSGTNFWQELVSKELTATSSSNPQLDTGTFTAKKYLWVNMYLKSNSDPQTTFNNDTGTNYAWRYNDDNGSDGSDSNNGSAGFHYGAHQVHISAYIINKASTEKLYYATITYSGGAAAASTVPVRREVAGKWANTSDQITSIQSKKSSMDMYSNSWIKVYGAD